MPNLLKNMFHIISTLDHDPSDDGADQSAIYDVRGKMQADVDTGKRDDCGKTEIERQKNGI